MLIDLLPQLTMDCKHFLKKDSSKGRVTLILLNTIHFVLLLAPYHQLATPIATAFDLNGVNL